MRTLVAGIGNIFFGDDAFGVEVVRRLAERTLPPGVEVVDFGIRGFDLALALLAGYDRALLVDVIGRGGAPGTLYVLQPDALCAMNSPDLHRLDPNCVLGLVRAWGGTLDSIRLVGCEPGSIAFEPGLSPPVSAAVASAVELVESLVVHA